MDSHIIIAIVGALLNMFLSLVVPRLLNKTRQPLLVDIKKAYHTDRNVILTSSIIIAITIYLALKVTSEINVFEEPHQFQLRNLSKLMTNKMF